MSPVKPKPKGDFKHVFKHVISVHSRPHNYAIGPFFCLWAQKNIFHMSLRAQKIHVPGQKDKIKVKFSIKVILYQDKTERLFSLAQFFHRPSTSSVSVHSLPHPTQICRLNTSQRACQLQLETKLC